MFAHKKDRAVIDQKKRNTMFGARFQHLELFEAAFKLNEAKKTRAQDVYLAPLDKEEKNCEEKLNQLKIANSVIEYGWRNVLQSCKEYQKEFSKALKEGEIAPIVDRITKQTVFPLSDCLVGSRFVEKIILSQRKKFETNEKFFLKNFNKQVFDRDVFGKIVMDILLNEQLLESEQKKAKLLPAQNYYKVMQKSLRENIDALSGQIAKQTKILAKKVRESDQDKLKTECKVFLKAYAENKKAGKVVQINGLRKIQFFQNYVDGVKLIKSLLTDKKPQ